MSSQNHAPTYAMISGTSLINGGTFIQNNGGNGRKSSFDILREAVAHTAFHDSGARFDPPKCHPNTRVAVLNKIMDWIRRSDSEMMDQFIMWLTGAAGAGKSAIAQSLIELCLLEDLVIASFFFSRSDGSRNHGGPLVATLAYQIYQSVPAVQQEILSAIDADPFILTKSIERQLLVLVADPLSRMHSAGGLWPSGTYRVIVIDGLDECKDIKIRQQILRAISNTTRQFKLPILFLVASRPDHDINLEFRSSEMDGIYTRLYLDDSFSPDDDIRKFLLDSFEEIRTNHPFKSAIPASWPNSYSVDCVVRKSSGQFIYAVTVVRYVASIRHRPNHRFDTVMNVRPVQRNGDLPFAELDALYAMILSSAADIDRVLYALSIYLLHVITGQFDISTFLSLDEAEIDILFCDLGALIIPEWKEITQSDKKNHPVKMRRTLRILHASLHDYMLDPARSKNYYIDINVYRTQHIEDIFKYLSSGHDREWSIHGYLTRELPLCESSVKLLEIMALFPLAELVNAEIVNHPHKYAIIRPIIFFHLLPFLRRMSHMDKKWLEVEKRQHAALDKFFFSQIPAYRDHEKHTALLCVVYHIGNDAYVPWIPEIRNTGLAPYKLAEDDTLLLGDMEASHVGTDKDQYRQCLIRFLQDSKRSRQFTIGPVLYTNAVLGIIKMFENLAWGRTHLNFSNEERSISLLLTFKDGLWNFHNNVFIQNLWFRLLGYTLFFLPRCGKSEQLIQHCRQQTFLTEPMLNCLPTRTALVRQAMKEYLERMEA